MLFSVGAPGASEVAIRSFDLGSAGVVVSVGRRRTQLMFFRREMVGEVWVETEGFRLNSFVDELVLNWACFSGSILL